MSSFVIICHLLFATWQTTADVGHDPSWIILCLLAKRAQHHWQYFKTWSPLIVDWCLCDRTGRLTGQRLRSMSSWRRRSLELRLTVPPSSSSRRKTSWWEEDEIHLKNIWLILRFRAISMRGSSNRSKVWPRFRIRRRDIHTWSWITN